MKKILLIGKNGYVGTSFKSYMRKYREYKIDSVSSRNYEWEKLDFSNYDAIFNVSGLAHANAKQASDKLYFEVNGKLPFEIAKKAKEEKVPLYIHMSSMIVFGNMSELGRSKVIRDNTIPQPDGVYGKSKLMSENLLHTLEDETFQVAIVRPPLIYGENARDNFPRLVKFALKSPIFPELYNEQSMIYIDNLCELVHLIIDNQKGGVYCPQQKEYIRTSKIVKDIAREGKHKILLTKVFNPALRVLSRKVGFIQKAFGSIVYDMKLSDCFEWKYCVVDYNESIKRIVEKRKS